MFTDTDYIAARVRDAARYLNETIERAMKSGLVVSLKIVEGQPESIVLDIDPP